MKKKLLVMVLLLLSLVVGFDLLFRAARSSSQNSPAPKAATDRPIPRAPAADFPQLKGSVAIETPVVTAQTGLDQKIQAGLAALQFKNWQQAQASFEGAIKIFEEKPSTSPWVLTKLSLSASNSVVTVNGKSKDVSEQVNGYRQVMGTQQALYEFAAFSAQLAGDGRHAEQYLEKVNGMRGVMWGKSWVEIVPRVHAIFFSSLGSDSSENFSKYLLMAGRLLLDAQDQGGLKLIRQAKQNLPKDASIPALLASYLIVNNDPAGAKAEAQASLALDQNQTSVLIDLATAEWLLGELDLATKAARKAAELDSTLPGPHATLAFVALETGDASSALKEANLGNKLSNGHTFYKTILAVSFKASGDTQQGRKLMLEAWDGGSPDEQQLKAWFFRGKALEYARALMKPEK